jgi:hypothetical protein
MNDDEVEKPDYLKRTIEVSIVFFLCVGLWYTGNYWHWSIPACFVVKLAYYYAVVLGRMVEEQRRKNEDSEEEEAD